MCDQTKLRCAWVFEKASNLLHNKTNLRKSDSGMTYVNVQWFEINKNFLNNRDKITLSSKHKRLASQIIKLNITSAYKLDKDM